MCSDLSISKEVPILQDSIKKQVLNNHMKEIIQLQIRASVLSYTCPLCRTWGETNPVIISHDSYHEQFYTYIDLRCLQCNTTWRIIRLGNEVLYIVPVGTSIATLKEKQ